MKKRLSYKSISAGVVLLFGFLVWVSPAQAATFVWNQTNWTGAASTTLYAAHPTNETGWTNYSAADPLMSISGSGLTVSSTTGSSSQYEYADFSGGTFSSTTESGTTTAGTVLLSQPTQNAAGTWTSAATSPNTIGAYGNGLTGANGYLYFAVIGGSSVAMYRYSSSTNTWAGLASFSPGNNPIFDALYYPGTGDTIYLVASPNASGNSIFEAYSISGNSWSSLSATGISGVAAYGALAGGNNGYLYFASGPQLYQYSISGNSWTTLTSSGSSYGAGAMAYANNGYLYVADENTTSFYRYSIAGNSWSTMAGLPVSPAAPSLVYPGSGNIIYFGRGGSSGAFYGYSISGNSWTTLNSSPGGADYEGGAAYPGMGNYFYSLGTYGGSYNYPLYKYEFATQYYPSGTFISSPMNLGQDSIPSTFNFNALTTSSTSIQFQIRSATSTAGLSSAAWEGPTGPGSYYTTSGQTINSINAGSQYFQYEAYLTTNDITLTTSPSLSSTTINFIYYPATTTLTSSPYNSSSAANLLAKIAWTATTNASTSVKFQIRSAPDNGSGAPGTWSSFVGPDGTSNTYFASSTGGDTFPADLATSSQWFEYKTYLTTVDGSAAPALLSAVNTTYVVNAPPQFSTGSTTASQTASGTVAISYSVLDPDTSSGTRTPGFITPSFEYSLNGGSTWTLISTSTLRSSDYTNKAVNQSTFTTYTALWNAPAQIPNQYSTTTLIQVIANDNEAANNLAYSSSTAFTLDTTPPAEGPIPVIVDESQSPALVTFNATDNSPLYVKVGNETTFANAAYGPYTATTTLSLNTGDTVSVQFQDAFSNATSVYTVTPPETPSNIFYEDTSDPDTQEWRIFFAWGVIDNPPAGFLQYNIYRSVNGSPYSLLTTVTNRNLNYIVDTGLTTTSTYAYKLTAEDSNGDVSFYSASISHEPNGTGGTDLSVPVLSDVTTSNITSTGATITWTTNKYADSTIYYSATSSDPGATQSSYQSSTGVPAVVETHSVTLSNLTPGTQYYFLAQSIDPDSNIGISSNSSYNFTTTAGPVISNTTVSSVFDNTATITWNTDSPSNSTVYYSTSPTMASPATLGSGTLTTDHSVTLTGLITGMKYYYYVTSADSHGNTAIDNNVVNGTVEYYDFSTTDNVNPPVISQVTAGNIGVTGATITWVTDENSTSQVTYGSSPTLVGATTTPSDGTYNTSHAVILSGLTSGATYYYTVYSDDENGNATSSPNDGTTYSFTTATASSYLTPPSLDNVEVASVTPSTANISWDTSTSSDSSVFYVATSSYPGASRNAYQSSVGVPSLVSSHVVTLTGLTPSTQYYFFVQSTDASNDVGTSSQSSYTFTTTAGAAISSTTASSSPDGTSATVTWNTSIPADSAVYYSASSSMSNPATLGSQTLTTSHSVTLTGLTQGVTYYYYVTSTDGSGNVTTDDNVVGGIPQYYNFTTESDVPPVISGVTAANIGITGATIIWTTDKSATAQVTFATSSNMSGASTTATTTNYGTAQAVLLSNLTAGTTYYYTVYSADQYGNATSSPNDGSTYSFTTGTVSGFSNPPVLSAVTVGTTTPSTAQISWTTTTDSDSSIFYIATSSYPGSNPASYQSSVGIPSLVESHAVTLTGLTPSTQYFFFVQSTDASSEVGSSTSSSYTFTTPAGPVISSTTATTIMDTSATVTWNTTIPADSVLYYSTSPTFTNSSTVTGSRTLTTQHAISLVGLTQGTEYYYYVTSTDGSGNTATDNNIVNGVPQYYNFTTVSDNVPPVISNVLPSLVGINGATITWVTDKATNAQVTYDTDPAFGTATSTTLTTSFTPDQSVTLSNLAASTTYYYWVYSADQNGNSASSTEFNGIPYSFTTESPGTTTIQTVYAGGGGGGGAVISTPPTISNISVTQTGEDSVNVSFTTSEIANGVVNYGPDSGYGDVAGDPTIYQLVHSVTLANLAPMATYHFSVEAADVNNDSVSSADATFTLADFSNPSVNTDLYDQANPTASSTPASAAGSGTATLTADQQTLLNDVKNVSVQMAEEVLNALAQNANLSSIPQDQFTAAIDNLTSKIVSAPVISGSNITVTPGSNSAEITWDTDKPSNSMIAYATSADYDPDNASSTYTITAGNPNDSVTSHDITLPNLSPDTTYHFQVRSQGALGPAASSTDHTFKTSSSLPQVFNANFTDIGENSAILNWSTDVPTKTKITLKNTQTGVSSTTTETSYNTDHTYSFDDLDFSTPYTITLIATNASSTASDPLVVPFSTVLSTAAPVISNVRITTSLIPGNVETAQTIVSWTTDKPSTSKIFFGQGSDGDLTQSTDEDPSLTTDHVVITTLLTPGTVYKIKAESGDSSGNITDSAPYTVLTPAPAGSIVDLIISNLQSTFGVFAK